MDVGPTSTLEAWMLGRGGLERWMVGQHPGLSGGLSGEANIHLSAWMPSQLGQHPRLRAGWPVREVDVEPHHTLDGADVGPTSTHMRKTQ